MNDPLISVIIPAYNAENFVVDATESIFRQNYDNLEVIVVNDGSTDATLDVLGQFGDRIRIISQENRGVSAARNTGIRAAKGSIIGFLDHDDIWSDDHILSMLTYLGDGSEYDYVRGLTRPVKYFGTESEDRLEHSLVLAKVCACLYRKSVFDKVGLFNEEMLEGEDGDLNLRISDYGCKEKRINKTTVLYRRHENNMTNSDIRVNKCRFNNIRNHMKRLNIKNISSK